MPLPTTSNIEASKARGLGYAALIGELYVRSGARLNEPIVVESAPLEPPRVNLGTNPEDFGSEYGATFSRSDFSGGEGLDYGSQPDRQPIDLSRYYDSRNLDFDDDGSVSLLEVTELIEASANTGIYADHDGTTLRWTDGTTLRATTNPTAATPTIANESPHAGEGASTITGIVHVGTDLYAGVADGLHRYTVAGGAWTHLVTEANGMGRVWSAKGRCIYAAQDANDNWVLRELTDPTTPTTTDLITLPAGEEFCDLADASDYVAVTASDGFIYTFSFDGAAFSLIGQSRIKGEFPCGIGAIFGLVFFGTWAPTPAGGKVGRFYRASFSDTGTIQGFQELRQWGDPDTETQDRTPYWVDTGRDSVFTAVVEDADETHLWRYDLSSGGLHRSYVIGDNGVSRSFSIVEGTPWVFVDAAGTYRVSSTLASSGYLVNPLSDVFSPDEKPWVSVDIGADVGTVVNVAYTDKRTALDDADSTDWASLGDANDGGQLQLSGVKSRYLATKLTLTAGTVRFFSQRAYPPESDTILTIPVNVSDQVSRPGRRRMNIKRFGNSVEEQLRAMIDLPVRLNFLANGKSYRGLVESVSTPHPELTPRGSTSLISQVRFRGRPLVDNNPAGGGFGSLLWGEGDFGG